MPKFTTAQEVAAAIEDCVEQGGKLILRFGHGQIRQLGWEDCELLLNALKPSSAPEGATTGWRSIDSAPKDGTDVLLTTWGPDGYGEIDVGCFGFIEKSDWDGKDVIGWMSNYGRIEEPTHWMPLPPPPQNGSP